MDEAIKIDLNDGSSITTTPNHLFLCPDGQFRKVTPERDASQEELIKKGTQLAVMGKDLLEVQTV